MSDETTRCTCLGGSTHGTDEPAVRRCDMCGGIVPTDPKTGEYTAPRRDDGSRIYNEPAVFDEAECEARGRADRAAGVNAVDCPYVAGLPVYAWERGYHG